MVQSRVMSRVWRHLGAQPAADRHAESCAARAYGTGMHTSSLSWNAVRWFALAVAALAVSGFLAVVLVLARVPAIATTLMLDPELARRSLVVHVNLATGVWFFAFIAGLFGLARGADAGVKTGARRRAASAPVVLAAAGVIAFSVSALSDAGAVLADYVPVIDHWLFFAGLAAFAVGIALDTLRLRRVATANLHAIPLDAQYGLRAAGIAFAIAMVTIVTSYLCRAPGATRLESFAELFWGGGHVLQFAATAGMLATWLVLFHHIVGTSALSSRLATRLFALLLLPTALAPWLVATGQSPRAFTWMMELGIGPAVLLVVGAGLATAARHGRPSDVHWPVQGIALVGLGVSIGMTLVGFGLGAAITEDTTLTPAHYHVSIGAVTVSFMATLMVLLPAFGAPIRWPRLAVWQPLLYGCGQTVFALGLAIAGFWGHSARKLYATDQVTSVPVERLGWIIAGIGGLFAFVGGVAFVVIVLGCRHGRARDRVPAMRQIHHVA